MNVERTPAFRRDLRRVTDRDTQRRAQEKIAELEAASTFFEVTSVRRLVGGGRHYRIRVGGYRLGITMDGETAVLRRFLLRGEFYRYFP